MSCSATAAADRAANAAAGRHGSAPPRHAATRRAASTAKATTRNRRVYTRASREWFRWCGCTAISSPAHSAARGPNAARASTATAATPAIPERAGSTRNARSDVPAAPVHAFSSAENSGGLVSSRPKPRNSSCHDRPANPAVADSTREKGERPSAVSRNAPASSRTGARTRAKTGKRVHARSRMGFRTASDT